MAKSIPYYAVLVRYRDTDNSSGPWEIHNGFYRIDEAHEERDWVIQDEGVAMATCRKICDDSQAEIDRVVASMNERLGFVGEQ